jgi:hypothetical protein
MTLQTAENLSWHLKKASLAKDPWKYVEHRVIVAAMRVLKNQLRQLKKFLRRRGSSPQDAEDLVQEAVVRRHLRVLCGWDPHR